ncbi:MAG: hypothetical protein Q8O40_01505 [Chloroflexota bacterium]|nr:hypothetical protein [Chloroflexota bacterium]
MSHNKHYVKLFLAVAAVAILALASLGTALATPRTADATKQGLFGAVTAQNDTSLTIETKDGKQVILAVTPDTKFHIAGGFIPGGAIISAAVSSRVAALVSVQGDAWTALQVMVIPSRPTIEHATITVVEVQGNTIVGEDQDGNRLTIELPKPASPDLVGQLLTVVVKKVQSGTDTKVRAQASVSMKDVVERVKGHAAELRKAAGNEADAKRRDEREKELDKLTQRLEDDMQRHLDRFSEVIAKAPSQAQDSLKAALENYRKGYEGALDALGKATPQAKEQLNTVRSSGTVASVDAAAGKLTVNLPNGAQLALTTDSSTKVSVGEKEATLSDVSVGDSVEVAYKLQQMLAVRIVVRTEGEAKGAIQAVDSANLTLTLANNASLVLSVTSVTKVELDGKAATTADLKAGMRAEAEYDLRSLQAFTIEASSNDIHVDGALKSVEFQASTITLVKSDGAELTLKITPETRISARGLVLALSGLKTGIKVKAVYNASTMEARSILVWTESERNQPENRGQVAGLIASVDATQGFVSIQAANGAAVTLKVGEKTAIHLNGKDAKLSDLAAGTQVTASYEIDSQTAVEIKAAMRPAEKAHLTIRGSMTTVDTGTGTVTVQFSAPVGGIATVIVKVTSDTKVTLDGKKTSLSDLAAGQSVLVQFYAQSKEAVKLEAFSKANIQGRTEQGKQSNTSGGKDNEKPAYPNLVTPTPRR